MPTKYDELRPYATDRQIEYFDAVERENSVASGCSALGISERAFYRAIRNIKRRAAAAGYSPDHDLTHPVPDGFLLKGASTLYDQDGLPKQQWVKSVIDPQRQEALLQEAIQALCEDVKPAKPVKAPAKTMDTLMSVYPVGDHHFGMMSWGEETGEDYDTSIAEALLIGAVDYLVDAAPASEQATLILLGDLLHYDSYEAVTPRNRNLLDSDSRYPKIVNVAMHTVRYCITRLLRKHEKVGVVVVGGNHDPSSMVFLRVALAHLYEREPRVEVDAAPTPFHYVRFGKVLIATHHGDKVKPDKMPGIIATDRPQDWGETEFRYCYSGHVHHDAVKDFPGVRVESVRVLPPTDAWSHAVGYRSGRDMRRIDLHRDFGEVARQTVNPAMLRND